MARAAPSSPRCCASTPLATERRSVGRLQVAVLEQLAGRQVPASPPRTRPPVTAPPSTKATVPVPWSVPLVPFTRTVRPNSVIVSTAVCRHASPSACLERRQSGVELLPARAASRWHLRDVRVPAADLQRGDPWTIRCAQQLAGGAWPGQGKA